MADIILIIVLLLFACAGYRKGFAKTLISASVNLISIIFSIVFTNPVAKVICQSPIGKFIIDATVPAVTENVNGVKIPLEAVEMATNGVCMTVSSILSFILIALVVRIAVGIISGVVDIAVKLPLLKQANSVLGAVTGGISGFLICYIVVSFLFVLSDNSSMELKGVVALIEKSKICSFVFNNNILENISSLIKK